MNKHSNLCAYGFWQTACKRAFIFEVASTAGEKKKVVLIIASSAQLALTDARREAQWTGFYLELCDNVGSQSIELSWFF